MKNFMIALRSLFKKGRSNGIKILSLGVGLAMGLVLISKVCFESSFDSFYPDSERIYRMNEQIERDGQLKTFNQVSGAVATGMKEEIPEVELATRLTYISSDNTLFTTEDKARYSANCVLMADSNVFDVLPVPILLGNPKEVLARPGYVMISRKLAEKMGGIGSVEGKTFQMYSNPSKKYIIGGVFENIPENSHLRYDMLVSLNGMNEWSLKNWVGNDRYLAYIKLYPGVSPENLKVPIRAMMERHVDMNELQKAGVDYNYGLTPLAEMHSATDEVRDMNNMLLSLAFILILTAVMNYILIVLSTLMGRTKEVAVHKCYGASDNNLLGMIMSETCLHMLLSLVVAAFLILLFKTKVEVLLGASLGALFTPQTLILLIGICLLVFLITGLIPTYMFLRIPVAAAFRSYRESKRYWKLCLLFVQFAATAYLVALLGVINRQYDKMINDNPGYSYEKLFYYECSGLSETTRESTLQELAKLPVVEEVSSSCGLPIYGASGNNVSLPNDDRELFNIADLYWVNDNFFSLMEVPIIEGEAFRQDGSSSDKVMVSRSFAEKISKMVGWQDGVVGKGLHISEHSQSSNDIFTICGVYDDIRIGSIADADPDLRPTIVFWGKQQPSTLLVKLREVTPENVQQITDLLAKMLPDRDITVGSYKMDMVNLYQESGNFRDAILIGGVVTLIIALIGLLGYTADETNRRGREIAIRKVNGATSMNILSMISKDVSFIAIPALIVGISVAGFSGEKWLKQFVDKIPLNLPLFVISAFCIYLVIIACVFYRAWKVANDNPVESLKAE